MYIQEAWVQAKEVQKIRCENYGGYKEITKEENCELNFLRISNFLLMSDQWEIVKEKKKVEIRLNLKVINLSNTVLFCYSVKYIPETAKIYAEWEE